MSSLKIDNSGQFHSEGFQLIGNNFTTNGGSVYINTSSSKQSETKIDLSNLKFVKEAAFDAYEQVHQECHSNTRVDLLREIQDWTHRPESRNVFWLQGMAGTGKSTISYAIAKWLYDQGASHAVDLGASFFFKRGEGDRGSAAFLFPTIAYQLARKVSGFGVLVATAIENDPDICSKALGEQFTTLIREPLSKLPSNACDKIYVIVVDALDECKKEDIDVVLQLWLHNTPVHLRLFLTSRPDLPVRLQFKKASVSVYQELILHDIPQIQVRLDIFTFLRDKFTMIRQEYDDDYFEDEYSGNDWPGEEILQKLTDIAVPLFIVAATIYRFVNDHLQDPFERLRLVLNSNRKIGHLSPLATIYLPVLQQLQNPWSNRNDQDELYTKFRMIVGSIITLVQPLSQIALADLLGISKKPLSLHLRPFASVLHIPSPNSNEPIRPLHLSFGEFLTGDETRGQPFSIDSPSTHGMLMTKCLELLSRAKPDGLHENMCHLSHPGQLRQDIVSEVIRSRLSSAVQYACRYWTYHAQNSGKRITDHDAVHDFLQKHYLHWLEALSLLDHLADAVAYIETLQSLVALHNAVSATAFLEDARRFVLSYRYIINVAPLQVYSSAIVFAPQKSIVRNVCGRMSGWILQGVVTPKTWGPELQQLEGHIDKIGSLVFSPDGQQLASGSDDGTVRLWDTKTGQELQKLKCKNNDNVLAVAFSFDGSQLATATYVGHISLWETATGQELQKRRIDSQIRTAVFSPNGWQLASTSYKERETIRLWDIRTGEQIKYLKGHTEVIDSMAFSPDNQKLVSGSKSNDTIRLWDVETGREITNATGQPLIGMLPVKAFGYPVVVFSPNGRQIASGSRNGRVQVWDVETGEDVLELKGCRRYTSLLIFSPNSRHLASGSEDQTIRIWDVKTGREVLRLEVPAAWVTALAFSPDGRLLASGFRDGIARLWDVTRRQEPKGLIERTEKIDIDLVEFSPNGRQLAAGFDDGTMQLWDVETGQPIFDLEEGQTTLMTTMVFSSDGRQLASGFADGTIRVWHTDKEQLILALEGERDSSIWTVLFSPDNQQLAAGYYRGSLHKGLVRLWDIGTGQKKIEFEGGDELALATLDFSHDGRQLIASENSIEKRWDTKTGQQIQYLGEDVVAQESHRPDHRQVTGIDGNNRAVDSTNSQGSLVKGRDASSLEINDDWIECQGERLLWLPASYRPDRDIWTTQDDLVAIAIGSGVKFLRLRYRRDSDLAA